MDDGEHWKMLSSSSYGVMLNKYKVVYLNDYQSALQLYHGLEQYFSFPNHERPHKALDGRTPAEIHNTSDRLLI
jgi:putative transposase